jgi:hypothetical protein
MRRVREQHNAAILGGLSVACIKERADDHDAGHLSLRACCGLQAYPRQTGYLSEIFLNSAGAHRHQRIATARIEFRSVCFDSVLSGIHFPVTSAS